MRCLDPVENFWAKVKRGDGCWLWQGATNWRGYGCFQVRMTSGPRQKHLRAHRFSWELAHGPIPAGMWVLHHCDVPACVRPSHLYLGDNAANVADRMRRGRDPKGDGHWARRMPERVARGKGKVNAKLDENVVREIRTNYPAEGSPITELALRFGVSKAVIWHVLQRRTWKHV